MPPDESDRRGGNEGSSALCADCRDEFADRAADPGFRFCPSCGGDLSGFDGPLAFCPVGGNPMPESPAEVRLPKFCIGCGVALPD